MLVATGLLVGFFFLSTLYLQHALGFSALKTGLIFCRRRWRSAWARRLVPT
jgi:hypothetical protein